MSKVILVLPEMPEKCTECPACSGHGIATLCRAEGKFMNACIGGRPSWCPLRLMPEKEDLDYTETWAGGYKVGWNDVIRAIEGSGEDEASDREE